MYHALFAYAMIGIRKLPSWYRGSDSSREHIIILIQESIGRENTYGLLSLWDLEFIRYWMWHRSSTTTWREEV